MNDKIDSFIEKFNEYSKERKTLNIREIDGWKNDLNDLIRKNIDCIATLALQQSTKKIDIASINTAKQLWSPELVWNIAHIPEFNSLTTKDSANVYGIVIRYYMSLKTTLEALISQFQVYATKLSDNTPKRLITCNDEVFIREFYERVFQYADIEKQKELVQFIENRFSVQFLDYSDEYYAKGYFDIHQGRDKSETTAMAVINKEDGSLIYRGDYVIGENN